MFNNITPSASSRETLRDVWVKVNGMDIELEVWELLRLFFNAESIHFFDRGELNEGFRNVTDPVNLLVIDIRQDEKEWHCQAFFYPELSNDQIEMALSNKIEPRYFSEKRVNHDEMAKPGGSLLRSRKVLAGSCIVDIMSRFTKKNLPYGALIGIRPVKLAMQCIDDGMDKSQTVSYLVKATGMCEEKAKLLYDVAEAEKPWVFTDKKAVHLYIGIPFCASRCLYCSFTAYPIQRYKDMVPAYLNALTREIQYVADWINKNGLKITSIYVGGGTPTSIDADSLTKLLMELNKNFKHAGIEFTVEAGRPDTITEDKLEAMRSHNVSRISINPQTMNSDTLRLIGRNHTPEDIEEKFYMARRLGFDNINMDLIAGLPEENEEMFNHTLRKIEALAPESLTVHTMALKRASRLCEQQIRFSPTPDEIVETMIEAARHSARKMGMRPYYLYRQKNILANLENTGYAKPGFECLYNIHTMEECQTIVAIGAGAISKFVFPDENRIERVFNLKEVSLYIERIDEMIERKKQMFREYEKILVE